MKVLKYVNIIQKILHEIKKGIIVLYQLIVNLVKIMIYMIWVRTFGFNYLIKYIK